MCFDLSEFNWKWKLKEYLNLYRDNLSLITNIQFLGMSLCSVLNINFVRKQKISIVNIKISKNYTTNTHHNSSLLYQFYWPCFISLMIKSWIDFYYNEQKKNPLKINLTFIERTSNKNFFFIIPSNHIIYKKSNSI